MANGKHFLNLFAYTGSATLYAVQGGAKSTVSVDSSNVYLEWARKNLALNGFSFHDHEFLQDDCLSWLKKEERKFDLILLDPPTYSDSKKFKSRFLIEKDHPELILAATRLLHKNGILIFSNNYQKFKLDQEKLKGLTIENLTQSIIPKDFKRNLKIINCWKITN